jgi:hypothetical protein
LIKVSGNLTIETSLKNIIFREKVTQSHFKKKKHIPESAKPMSDGKIKNKQMQ